MEAATQVPVNTEKEDRSFASMGRAALRMDPDVIILGEMRDEDTAHVMVTSIYHRTLGVNNITYKPCDGNCHSSS